MTTNDPYNEYIERNGKLYRYDPDYDCYYAINPPMTHSERFGWLYACLVLAVICACVEYFR
jgi:hypothetical protein